MPISKKWSKATAQNIRSNVPESGGVYELKAFGELVYIGKSKNLQSRLLEHLRSRDPNYYRYKKSGFLQSPSSMEQNQLDAYSTTEIPPWNDRDPRN